MLCLMGKLLTKVGVRQALEWAARLKKCCSLQHNYSGGPAARRDLFDLKHQPATRLAMPACCLGGFASLQSIVTG